MQPQKILNGQINPEHKIQYWRDCPSRFQDIIQRHGNNNTALAPKQTCRIKSETQTEVHNTSVI